MFLIGGGKGSGGWCTPLSVERTVHNGLYRAAGVGRGGGSSRV